MRFVDSLGMSLGDLKKRKMRTFLTALAVAIGSMLVMTMVGMGTSFQDYIMDMLKSQSDTTVVAVQPMKQIKHMPDFDSNEEYRNFLEKSKHKIDKNTIETLRNLKGVKEIVGSISFKVSSMTLNGKVVSGVEGYGYNPKDTLFSKAYIDLLKSQKGNEKLKPYIAGKGIVENENSIIIAQELLSKFGIKDPEKVVGMEATLTSSESGSGVVKLKPLSIKVKIAGVIDKRVAQYKEMIATNEQISNELKSYYTLKKDYLSEDGYDMVELHAIDNGSVAKICEKVKKMNYSYGSREELAKQVNSYFVIIKRVLAALGLIVLFVAALGIVNTMIMAINERTKSIGIMKSLGASSKNVQGIFMVESGVIGLIGGIMGLLISLMNAKVIGTIIEAKMKDAGQTNVMQVSLPVWLQVATVSFAILIAILAGIYPAAKAAALDPVVALNSK